MRREDTCSDAGVEFVRSTGRIERRERDFLEAHVPVGLSENHLGHFINRRPRRRERKRKMPPDAVHARHQETGPSVHAQDTGQEHEPPHRHDEIAIEPRVTELLPGRVQYGLQPGIPWANKILGHPPTGKVPEAGELSIPAWRRLEQIPGHSAVGQRNWLSSGRRKGFRTLGAEISKTARRPSTEIAATNRSSCFVSSILTPPNI